MCRPAAYLPGGGGGGGDHKARTCWRICLFLALAPLGPVAAIYIIKRRLRSCEACATQWECFSCANLPALELPAFLPAGLARNLNAVQLEARQTRNSEKATQQLRGERGEAPHLLALVIFVSAHLQGAQTNTSEQISARTREVCRGAYLQAGRNPTGNFCTTPEGRMHSLPGGAL